MVGWLEDDPPASFEKVKKSRKIVKIFRGHQNTHFQGIKQYKPMATLSDFPYNNALFGLVI